MRFDIRSAALAGGIACLVMSATVIAAEQPTFDGEQLWRSALERKPDARAGAALYDTCAACHQSSGWGVRDGTVPAIAGQHYPYVLKRLAEFRESADGNPRMHHFLSEGRFDDPQALANVAAYTAALTPARAVTHGDGKALSRGREIYDDICALCHGASGSGDPRVAIPRISAQHYPYLLRQMRWIVQGTRHSASEYLVWLLSGYPEQDLRAVADYISRLEPRRGDRSVAEPGQ